MDTKALFDRMLASGKNVLGTAQNFAEKKLGIPESGPGRDTALSNLGKGALAGGLLAALLGTRTGRRATGKIIQLGRLAAIAGIAYKSYETWQWNQ